MFKTKYRIKLDGRGRYTPQFITWYSFLWKDINPERFYFSLCQAEEALAEHKNKGYTVVVKSTY